MIEALGKFVTWLNTNAGILSIIVAILLAVVPAIWTFIRYLGLKNRELQFERFKIYHQLIKDLVQPEAKGEAMMLVVKLRSCSSCGTSESILNSLCGRLKASSVSGTQGTHSSSAFSRKWT